MSRKENSEWDGLCGQSPQPAHQAPRDSRVADLTSVGDKELMPPSYLHVNSKFLHLVEKLPQLIPKILF